MSTNPIGSPGPLDCTVVFVPSSEAGAAQFSEGQEIVVELLDAAGPGREAEGRAYSYLGFGRVRTAWEAVVDGRYYAALLSYPYETETTDQRLHHIFNATSTLDEARHLVPYSAQLETRIGDTRVTVWLCELVATDLEEVRKLPADPLLIRRGGKRYYLRGGVPEGNGLGSLAAHYLRPVAQLMLALQKRREARTYDFDVIWRDLKLPNLGLRLPTRADQAPDELVWVLDPEAGRLVKTDAHQYTVTDPAITEGYDSPADKLMGRLMDEGYARNDPRVIATHQDLMHPSNEIYHFGMMVKRLAFPRGTVEGGRFAESRYALGSDPHLDVLFDLINRCTEQEPAKRWTWQRIVTELDMICAVIPFEPLIALHPDDLPAAPPPAVTPAGWAEQEQQASAAAAVDLQMPPRTSYVQEDVPRPEVVSERAARRRARKAQLKAFADDVESALDQARSAVERADLGNITAADARKKLTHAHAALETVPEGADQDAVRAARATLHNLSGRLERVERSGPAPLRTYRAQLNQLLGNATTMVDRVPAEPELAENADQRITDVVALLMGSKPVGWTDGMRAEADQQVTELRKRLQNATPLPQRPPGREEPMPPPSVDPTHARTPILPPEKRGVSEKALAVMKALETAERQVEALRSDPSMRDVAELALGAATRELASATASLDVGQRTKYQTQLTRMTAEFNNVAVQQREAEQREAEQREAEQREAEQRHQAEQRAADEARQAAREQQQRDSGAVSGAPAGARHPWRRVTGWHLVIPALVLGIVVLLILGRVFSNHEGRAAGSPTLHTTQTGSARPTSPPRSASRSASHSASRSASAAAGRAAAPLRMSIRHWARVKVPGAGNQVELVVQPNLQNLTNTTIPAELGNFRALIAAADFNPEKWRSVQTGGAAPERVTIYGSAYWAVPANPNHFAEDAGNGYLTWATEWNDLSSLGPKQKYTRSGDQGVLAFYLPAASADSIVGLYYSSSSGSAVVDGEAFTSGTEACVCDW